MACAVGMQPKQYCVKFLAKGNWPCRLPPVGYRRPKALPRPRLHLFGDRRRALR